MTAGLSWVEDGVTPEEVQILGNLDSLSASDISLAEAAINLSWMSDEITAEEGSVINNLATLAWHDAPAAHKIAVYPWFTDGISTMEWDTVGSIANLAAQGSGLALWTADRPRMADNISDQAYWAVRYLSDLSLEDVDLARQIGTMSFYPDSIEEHDIGTLTSLLGYTDGEVAQIKAQAWFADGVDDDEAALVWALWNLATASPVQFSNLLETHYVWSDTVTSPIRGEVKVIGFRSTPFKQFDPGMPLVADPAAPMETFMGVSFPKDEIVVIFVDPDELNPINDTTLARHFGTHLEVTRPEVIRGDFRHAVAHEVAHYYWNSLNAPIWFREGGADFLASYTLDQLDWKSLQAREAELGRSVRDICAARGVDTIQDLLDLLAVQGYDKHVASPYFLCHYILGESLLLDLYQIMRPDGADATWEELYRQADSQGRPATESEIYEAFIRNATTDQTDEVIQAYTRWHGGSFSP